MEAHLMNAVKKLVKDMHEAETTGAPSRQQVNKDHRDTHSTEHAENKRDGNVLTQAKHHTQPSHTMNASHPDDQKLHDNRLHAELKENCDASPFEQVKKELQMLNTESQTRLYTGPYGRIQSPFKKFSSFRTCPRGVKRSPRKLPMPRSKKVKRLSDFDLLADSSSESESEETTSPEPDKIVEEPLVVAGPSTKPKLSPNLTDDEQEDSDSGDNQWQIIEDSDPEIDKQLEEKSSKYSLSAINVKSIIHKIVTNEKVVEMVRRAVLEQVEEQKLEYEPKMTRSKAKEVLETHGDIPLPLGLSPRKKTLDESKFVDIDLPEDEEDDEDFNPFKQVREPQGSEDDSESVQSSGFSDCETLSLPSTPTTPTDRASLLSKSFTTPTNTDNDNSNSFLSPMGPPLQNFVPRSQHKLSTNLGQKYRDAIEKDERAKREEEELIASRTRSKCPLNEVTLFDIEANFVAPDITEDLYDTACDDEDWNDFLKTLIVFNTNVSEDTNEAATEEEDQDPEFNFLEEAEHNSYDREDFRNDRGVKVSKKELNLLIDELNEAYNENDPIDINIKNMIKAQSDTIAVAQSHKRLAYNPHNLVYKVSESERRQIADQLRKHVQLLAQTFVLGMADQEEHENSIEASKMFLCELKSFSETSDKRFSITLLNVCNLPAALSLVSDSIWMDTVEPAPDEKKRLDSLVFKYENQKLNSLNYKQLKVLWTNPVFMYPDLLPHGGFCKMAELKKDRSRVKFIEAEDNLLAMGLDQFHHLPNGKEYIHNFMLPSKTKKQIQIRIKNLSAKSAKNNAVKYWKEHKQLPDFPQSAPFFNPCMMKACKDRPISLLEFPSWAVFFRPEDAADLSDIGQSKRYFGFSVNHLENSPLKFGGSSSVTPDQSTGSSNVTSSSSSGSSSNHRKPVLNKIKKVPRKRLNLDRGKRQPVPAFIPLTFSGKVKSITPSLTTSCLLDKNLALRTSLSSTGTSVVCSPGISVSNISPPKVLDVVSLPSVIVINNTPGSSAIDRTSRTSVMTDQGINPSSQRKRSETVDESLNNSNSNASVSTFSANPVKNTSSNTSVSFAPVSSDSGMCNMPVLAVRDHILLDQQTQQNTPPKSTDKSVVSMPVLTSTVTVGCSSPLAVTSAITNLDSSVWNSNNNAVTPGNASPISSDVSTPRHDELPYTPDCVSNDSTPTRSSMMSPLSEGESPKNALEIIASYAPYLLSPSPNKHHQKMLETTPKKRSGFIRLAPKPTPPGLSQSPPVSIRVPKVKSSPRRQKLNEQAKSILPKGFVVRTIDVSPLKKAASSLVEKAKHPGRKSKSFYFSSTSGYCKILPQPESPIRSRCAMSSVNSGKAGRTSPSVKSSPKALSLENLKRTSNSNSDEFAKTDMNKHDDNKENVDIIARDKMDGILSECEDGQGVDEDEDKHVDTESDYTQSEDGNDTQEDVDSQEEVDSQEDDDTHIANLMQASTTTRFDPGKEDASKSHLGKKDRDRDTTLAMLAPDVITSDPQRDMRDTAYAQAYLHKVKKVLRDDMDKLEKFLYLMYNFSSTKESPVELYMELRTLFKDHPGLVHDFAGFLLQDQAVECGCYDAFEEFNLARSFLRKLELYFSKTPYHFQRIIKTFSRWYRKPGRSTKELKIEIEPLLKSHKYLLEEFSKFFPEEQPPDSMMDDFEEIHLEGSDEELKYDSFEEIELFEGEEVLGTKRCTCVCHESKDDTFGKKKKHCYRCCLTVIDGELVYRVNKSTIKKIQITFGPSVKASSILSPNGEEAGNQETNKQPEAVNSETSKQPEGRQPFVVDMETENQCKQSMVDMEVRTESVNQPGTCEELMHVDREPSELDSGCVVDSDGLEKDITTDGSATGDDISQTGKSKSTDDAIQTNIPGMNVMVAKSTVSPIGDGHMNQRSDPSCLNNTLKSVTTPSVTTCGVPSSSSLVSSSEPSILSTASPFDKSAEVIKSENNKVVIDETKTVDNLDYSSSTHHVALCQSSSKSTENSVSGLNEPQKSVSDISNSSKSSSETALANDILAAAFNAALMSEVSLDTVFPFPLATKSNHVKTAKGMQAGTESGHADQVSKISAPREKDLTFKPEVLPDNTRIQALHDHPTGQSQLSISSNSSFTKVISNSVVDSVAETEPKIQFGDFDSSQPFSPFSPFGQEIQNITNTKNTALNKAPSKIRRITPIPVRISSEEDQSFQSVVQNSPVITDMIHSPLAQVILDKSDRDSNSSNVKQTSSQESHQSISVPFTDFGSHPEFISEKSVEVVSASQSDDSEKSLCVSVTGEISPFSLLKISQPNLFSEDANVAFTRASEITCITSTISTISDDSLLQCLAKPPHFNDTIGTVSNLTNILNALDERTSHTNIPESHGMIAKGGENESHMSPTNSKDSNSCGFPSENSKSQNAVTLVGESKDALTLNVCEVTHDKDTVSKAACVEKVVESSSSESVLNTTDNQYFPQSTQSIENLERIKAGLFKVTSLSDSESSGVPTPCNSATQVVLNSEVLPQGQVQSANTHSAPSAKESESGVKVTCKDLDGAINVSSTTEGSFQDTLKTPFPDKSGEGKSETVCTDNDTVGNSKNEHSTDIMHDSVEMLSCSTSKESLQIGFKEDNSIAADSSDTVINAVSLENVNDATTSILNSNDISTDNPTKLVNEPKDKELRKRKKKEREGHKSSSSSHKKKKKQMKDKKEVESSVDSPDVSSQDSEVGIEQSQLQQKDFGSSLTVSVGSESCSGSEYSPSGSALSPGLMSTHSPGPLSVQSQGSSLHSPAPSSCSSSGVVDEEPMWTKETDRIILEKCKSHGVKEKTFVRIAKRLGDVTPKQVRKRFSHLYQLIFGAQFSSKGGQETS